MERVVQRLAEEQAREEHKVYVVTSMAPGSRGKPREESVDGVHVCRVEAIRIYYPDLSYPIRYPERVLKKSDVVHVHSQNSLFNVILAKRAKRRDRPIVVDFLALDYLKSHVNPLIRFFGGWYQERVQREATNLVDRAVTLNVRDYHILKEKYRLESSIVPHGIDEKYLVKPKDDNVFRKNFGVYDENIVTFIGRVHPSKGVDTLIEAVSLIVHEVDDFIVIIAGSGSGFYSERLSELAKKLGVEQKVRFLGYISENEKISLLDSSRALILPTQHFGEAYPLVIDEAYARGVPIVATQVGVLPYRIKHAETGILVPPDNPSSLAKALVNLLKDDDLFARMHKKLQTAKGSLLTWKRIVRMLDSIYEDILSRGLND